MHAKKKVFLLIFTVGIIFMGYINIIFCVCEGQLMKVLGFIFSGDQEKDHVEFFGPGIFKGVTQEALIYLEFLRAK